MIQWVCLKLLENDKNISYFKIWNIFSFFFLKSRMNPMGFIFHFIVRSLFGIIPKMFTTILTTRVWSMLFLWAYLNNLFMYIYYTRIVWWLLLCKMHSIKHSRISFEYSVQYDIAVSFDFKHVCCALMCICLSETNGMGGSGWVGWSTTTSMCLLFFLLYSLPTYIYSHQSMWMWMWMWKTNINVYSVSSFVQCEAHLKEKVF